MAKLDIKLTVHVQAEGANILAQTENVMRESLSSIMEDIIPDEEGISYQATLENLLTQVKVYQSKGTEG
mgnify:FL=1